MSSSSGLIDIHSAIFCVVHRQWMSHIILFPGLAAGTHWVFRTLQSHRSFTDSPMLAPAQSEKRINAYGFNGRLNLLYMNALDLISMS